MLLLKEVPQYECLLERAKRYPELDPSAMEAFLHLVADEHGSCLRLSAPCSPGMRSPKGASSC